MTIDSNIRCYLENLTSTYPEIDAIWLIGSRANASARNDSDWDLVAFGNEKILNSLREDTTFNCNNIDLLVVYDGNRFTEPWGDNPKHGSLEQLNWSLLSNSQVEYTQTKWIPNKEDTDRYAADLDVEFGDGEESSVYGYLVWQKQVGFVLEVSQ